jgi:hypothetical protein
LRFSPGRWLHGPHGSADHIEPIIHLDAPKELAQDNITLTFKVLDPIF